MFRLYAWDVAGRMGSQLISLAISIILARFLGPADYGRVSACLIFISFFDLMTNFGLGASLVQRKHPAPEHYHSSFVFNLLAGVALTLICFLTAPLLAGLFGAFDLSLILRVLSFSILISSLRFVQEAVLIKKLAFKQINQAKMLATAGSGVVGISMAFLGFGIWSLVAQVMIHRALNTALLTAFARWRPEFSLNPTALRDLWQYGRHLFMAGFVHTFFEHLDSMVIARIFSPVELGLFSRAKSLNLLVVKYSSDSLGAVAFPALSRVQDDRVQFLGLGLQAEKMTAFIAFGLLGWLYLVAGPVILLLLGNQWSQSIDYFKLLCLSGFAYPVGASILSMLKASGDSKTMLKLELLKKILLVAGLVTGFAFGMMGYLYSLIVTGLLSTLLNMYMVGKALDIPVMKQVNSTFVYAVPAVVAVWLALLIGFNPENHWAAITFFSLVFGSLYLSMNYLFKTIPK